METQATSLTQVLRLLSHISELLFEYFSRESQGDPTPYRPPISPIEWYHTHPVSIITPLPRCFPSSQSRLLYSTARHSTYHRNTLVARRGRSPVCYIDSV